MLEEHVRRLARLDGEVLLDFAALGVGPERRIRKDEIDLLRRLDVGKVLGERVREQDVRRLDSVEDHIHRADDERKRLLLLAEQHLLLHSLAVTRRLAELDEVGERLAEKARRTARAVVYLLADLRLENIDHRADERTRRVVFAAVASRVAHAADADFVERAHLVLVFARLELEVVHLVEDVAHHVAARQLALYAAEDFADLVLYRVRRGIGSLERAQVRKELVAHEVEEIVARQRLRQVLLAVFLRHSPRTPAVLLFEDGRVGAPVKLRRRLARLFEVVEVLEKENPARLLHVVKFAPAAGILPEVVVDPFVDLVVHGHKSHPPHLPQGVPSEDEQG